MPVEVIDVRKQLPGPTRKRHSILKSTKEWSAVLTKLERGLKPNEGLRVVLTQDTLDKVEHAGRLFKRHMERHLKTMHLNYQVYQRGTTEDGAPIIYISNSQG
jgi:hypothetical protein